MTKFKLCLSVAVTLFFSLAIYSSAQAQGRAFVSGTGSDTGTCIRTAPCRSFQFAHDALPAAGGEIVGLDSAGYGAVAISKNVKITGEGQAVMATAAGAGGIAISITTTANLSVTLQSLIIDGLRTGGFGVLVSAAGTNLSL